MNQPTVIKIVPTNDNGLMVIGDLGNGDHAGALIFRLSPNFALLYQKLYEGTHMDISSSLIALADKSYLYQFVTTSYNLEGVQYSGGVGSFFVNIDE